MKVVCSQSHDDGGEWSEYEIAPPALGMSARQTLEAKADSHADKGWRVVWHGTQGFTATKDYPEGRWARQRVRKFRLER